MECYCEVGCVSDPRCQNHGMCGKVMRADVSAVAVTRQIEDLIRANCSAVEGWPVTIDGIEDAAAAIYAFVSADISRLRVALKLGRDCVMESFEHVRCADDQYMADARLLAIDAALDPSTNIKSV